MGPGSPGNGQRLRRTYSPNRIISLTPGQTGELRRSLETLKELDDALHQQYLLTNHNIADGKNPHIQFAMRWNVVIGGQLFSKSFLGYTTYKMEFVAREGLLVAIVLTIRPFIILWALIKLLPP